MNEALERLADGEWVFILLDIVPVLLYIHLLEKKHTYILCSVSFAVLLWSCVCVTRSFHSISLMFHLRVQCSCNFDYG